MKNKKNLIGLLLAVALVIGMVFTSGCLDKPNPEKDVSINWEDIRANDMGVAILKRQEFIVIAEVM